MANQRSATCDQLLHAAAASDLRHPVPTVARKDALAQALNDPLLRLLPDLGGAAATMFAAAADFAPDEVLAAGGFFHTQYMDARQ